MTWIEIGADHLRAAKAVKMSHPRTCVSRAYYAAHAVLAEALVAQGYILLPGRETPPHNAQAKLIGIHLNGLGERVVREIRKMIRRLYDRRIDADYKRSATVDHVAAIEAIRDASTLFRLLGVTYS